MMSGSYKAIPFREVVTFSAEHPVNRVKNLLKSGSGKWTSPKGHDEIFIDVELSLPACYIKSLDIGNCWSATIDIEVGRADEASSKREPLLKNPANLMTRLNCQNGENKDVMKFFYVEDFNPFSVGRWVDRIRIVCRQPFRKDVAFGLNTLVVRGNNLDDDDSDDDNAKIRKGFSIDMSGIDGVKKLKSKLNKQFSSSTPKSKYSSLLSSLDSRKKSNKKDHRNNHGSSSLEDEFRDTVIEFINDVDPDNTLEYKELLRRWVQIRGRPKSETEKLILKEVTKSHAYGISSKKSDVSNDVVKKTFAYKRKSTDILDSAKKPRVSDDPNREEYSDDGTSILPQPKKRGRPPKNKSLGSNSSLLNSSFGRQPDPPSINYIIKTDPQKYVDYEERDLRSAGILVHQKIYKKDKKLPLDSGEELLVEKGVLVTFYKNAKFIHMKVKDKVYVPEVEPEYVSGIFKDYTEHEIEMSDNLVIEDPKISSSPPRPVFSDLSPSPKNTGSRKRKSSSPTKRVSAASHSSHSPETSPTPPPSKTTPGSSKGTKSKKVLAKSPAAGKSSTPSHKKKNYSSGGECPLCQKSFARIKELMAHCATCNGAPEKSSPSKASGSNSKQSTPSKTKGTPGRKKKTATSASNLSSAAVEKADCPICSKKIPKNELERHARLCAEKAFG